MKFLILDIETNGFNPDVIWCVVTKEYDTGDVKVWEKNSKEFKDYVKQFSVVAHNGIGFDIPVLNRLWQTDIRHSSVVDTLVLSRLRNSWDFSDHSLEAWGLRLNFPKGDFKDFSVYTPKMLAYCKQDVEITYKLFKRFEPFWSNPDFHKAIALEHQSAFLCHQMSQDGFAFDAENATVLKLRLEDRLAELDTLLQEAFPPKRIEEIFIPKANNKTRGYVKGVPFTKVSYKKFNPRSTKDRVDVLWDCGWEPFEKTKGHLTAERERDTKKLENFKRYGWKTSEDNLATLPATAPEGAKRLVEHLVLSSRHSALNEWLEAYDEETGRIYGRINHIGAWTHRKSHSNPNKANIPRIMKMPDDRVPSAVEQINIDYNASMRALWGVPEGKLLVGVDAEGIQLRILSHYLKNEAYAKAIVEGKTEDETDIHNVNKRAIGLNHITRDHAKTFIYAWILGAAIPKVASILETDKANASVAVSNFMDSIDGLHELRQDMIPYDARRGYFIGLDGRPVKCDSRHKMLAGYLQNGESVIMKWANRIWYRELKSSGVYFKQVNDVHDEWQTECNDDPEESEYIKQVQINSITQAGKELGVMCRLDGSGNIGKNWKETH